MSQEFIKVLNQIGRESINSKGELNYLKPLSILQKNKNAFSDPSAESMYLQMLSQYGSYVRYDSLTDLFKSSKIGKIPEQPFSLKSAEKTILEHAKDKQVIMMNEAHTEAEHRLFATSLLKPLYKMGFRVLALEALGWEDTAINERKYSIGTSGAYTQEPYFANFIRTALTIGFQIIPYEQKEFSTSIQTRENRQAENLHNYLKENPGAKMLVFAGHAHITEAEDKRNNVKWMANVFAEKTGINPLTIEQTKLEPREDISEVSVYTKDDKPWSPEGYSSFYDMMLVYPKNKTSLHKKLHKEKVIIDFSAKAGTGKDNTLLQVFKQDEYDAVQSKTIPMEQKIILNKETEVTLYLKPETHYFICIKDIDNNVISSQKIVLSSKNDSKIVLK